MEQHLVVVVVVIGVDLHLAHLGGVLQQQLQAAPARPNARSTPSERGRVSRA
jgi:hypothetical protein